ncbi:MAG: hypothetical protein IH627_17130 [Rubrivivax sp.]|nr:hypothetical protein [Rubrivivax sp.]
MGRVAKAGHASLRTLVILGARSLPNAAKGKAESVNRWTFKLPERRGYWRAVVAIAAKNARTAWAMLSRGERFVMPA